jgi:DNA-directed RNA polymerase subunit RPC12/RpoP
MKGGAFFCAAESMVEYGGVRCEGCRWKVVAVVESAIGIAMR